MTEATRLLSPGLQEAQLMSLQIMESPEPAPVVEDAMALVANRAATAVLLLTIECPRQLNLPLLKQMPHQRFQSRPQGVKPRIS